MFEITSYQYFKFENVQVQSLFNMFLSHTKEMFKKMNHIHPIGKNEGLVDDLGAEVTSKIFKEI